MAIPKLTILSSMDQHSIKSRAKFIYEVYLKYPNDDKVEFIKKFRFGGHRALRENLIRGLEKARIEFELNHRITNHQNEIGLLAGKDLLRKLTRLQIINQRKIVVGPNIFVTPKGFEFELQQKSVSKIIVPSNWVANLFAKELPEISQKIAVWPVGVDFSYWNPSALKDYRSKDAVLIYVKHEDSLLIKEIKSVLRKNGLEARVITYGIYTEDDYREELNNCLALIYVGKSESQGIALLEAWAMNVPTFVYNAKVPVSITSERGTLILGPDEYSTAPYLTDARGLFWSDINELESQLRERIYFSPRKQSEMFSAENCAVEYKKLFNE